MDKALRSYKEHREQELRQGLPGGAWGTALLGGSTPTPRPARMQRTELVIPDGRVCGVPPGVLYHGGGDNVDPADSTNANKIKPRLLTKRPQAKSAFPMFSDREMANLEKGGLVHVPAIRNTPVKTIAASIARVHTAHTGSRPLGSTPAHIHPDSPPGSELSFQQLMAAPCPSPCSSSAATSPRNPSSSSPTSSRSVSSTLDAASSSVMGAISRVGRANLRQGGGGEDQSLEEDRQVSIPVPGPEEDEDNTLLDDQVFEENDRESIEHDNQMYIDLQSLPPRSPPRSVFPTPTVSIKLKMEKKQSSQRRKPPGGAAAPGASKSVTVMEPAGKPSARDSKTSRDDSARKQNRDGSFFNSIRSPKRQYFTIHPEWVSENLSVSRMTLKEKTQTYPPRRCKSAPPPRSRNPITWEY